MFFLDIFFNPVLIDVDIPFDLPKKSDLSINTEKNEPNNVVEEIIKKLKLS